MNDRVLGPEAESQLVYDPVKPTIGETVVCRTVVVRAYSELRSSSKRSKHRSGLNRARRRALKRLFSKQKDPDGPVLVLDTETAGNQCLTFGALEWWDSMDFNRLVDRHVFYNDMPGEGLGETEIWALASICSELDLGVPIPLSRVFQRYIERVRDNGGYIVGFNLPFDLSRIASYATKACASGRRGARFLNGFALHRVYVDLDGNRQDYVFCKIKRDDRFKIRFDVGRARAVDLRSLHWALTDRGGSLETACGDFGVPVGDRPGEHYGNITKQNVEGCLYDVALTRELCKALVAEYRRHQIDLPIHRAQSPASMAKGYEKAMGIKPRLEHQPDFPKEVLGYAASAYCGGRVETLISKTPLPCMYVDANSMYPTGHSRLGLWWWKVADRLEIEWLDPQEVQGLVESVRENPHLLEDPSNWPQFAFFAEVESCGAHLPTRTTPPKNKPNEPEDRTINFGPTWCGVGKTIWVAGPDLAAAYLKKEGWVGVERAFRLKPVGLMPTLEPVPFRGEHEIDPSREDAYVRLIELRKKETGDELDDKRRKSCYKTMANSGAYGISAETNPEDVDPEKKHRKPKTVDVWSLDQFACEVERPERHGKYCFFPIASLVTAAARLILTLGQRLVEDEGGHVAYCDTDSLVIVANERGGFVPCEGGEYIGPDGQRYTKAVSYERVKRILERLEPLNPYDRTVIPGSVFKIEDANYIDGDPRKGRRALQFYGARDKCYALYTRDERGDPEIVKASSHGVGVYNAPNKALREIQKSELRRWVEDAWLYKLRRVHGLTTERTEWFGCPATRQLTISTYNIWKPYRKRCRPFDFLYVATFQPWFERGWSTCGCNRPRPATLPYDDARDWMKQEWFCLSCGRAVKLVNDDGVLLVKTYENVLSETMFNAFQRKRLSAAGESPTYAKPAIGLTKPRPVVIEEIGYCGKELLVDLSEAPEEEGLTPEELNGTIPTEYRKPASHEARRLLAKGVDIKTVSQQTRAPLSTLYHCKAGRKPREKTARGMLRACRAVATPDGRVDNNDDGAVRDLIRKADIDPTILAAVLPRSTVYHFLAGRKPHKPTLDKIRLAAMIAFILNPTLGDDANVLGAPSIILLLFIIVPLGRQRTRRARFLHGVLSACARSYQACEPTPTCGPGR